MSQQTNTLKVAGLDIIFLPGANMEHARLVAELVEERFSDQKLRSRQGASKDQLLTLVAFRLADELLRIKKKQGETESQIQALLEKIKKSI